MSGKGRLMSVALTEDAVRERRKTVTRRLGWWVDKNGRRMIQPGDRLQLCRKVMGRKKGEPLVVVALAEVVDVRRERLWNITAEEVAREGVPLHHFDEFDCHGQPTPEAWVRWFSEEMRCNPDKKVTRIEFRYLDCDESDEADEADEADDDR